MSPNGIAIPKGYRDWCVLSVSHRTDNHTLRVILGNDVAIRAAREGRTRPSWPDGSILAKLVWKESIHPDWQAAVVPDGFVHAEFMVKDAAQYVATGGWGFARWLGMELKPYGKDAQFDQECFTCHIPVKAMDYVFTKPAILP
ncbi:cytochrome P460 family protein [Desulfatirhabdium butyrativorans]|uniref:cytochrome P460 family protein n=1 Tax=Desulfatirhabdium butyrativorans TaxID=340467 RepID=UPI0004142AD0|nr:cytochrome P460 family protein [Desulfatirhabdium butyrativorans]